MRSCALAVGLGLTAVACSDSEEGAATTPPATTTTSPTTTVAPTTSTSTTSTTSTSTTSTSTTTTLVAVEGLDLSAEGLGDALFGADADGVVDYVRAILGPPTFDTDWSDPFSLGAACSGTEVRFVGWNDLSLFFTDDSAFASGLRHFASYTYGPAFGPTMNPFGLATAEGLGVGASIDDLQAAFPDGIFNPGDELFGPTFFAAEGLFVFLEERDSVMVAASFLGGQGCGE